MKKVLLTLVTVALVLTCVFAFVACKKPEIKDTVIDEGYGAIMPDAATIGTGITAIKDVKDGKAMLINALDNHYKCNYVAARLTGQVDTTVKVGVASIPVSQMVDNIRVRENGNQFMYNNSWTKDAKFPDIRLMDNNYYDGKTGKTKLISAAGKDTVDWVDGVMTASKWTPQDFDTKEAFMKVNPNDPNRLNMYILNDETIKSVTEPALKTTEGGQKYYAFHVVCDGAKAFKEYVPVMEYMLLQQGFKGEFDSTKMTLEMDVEVWENGLFKQFKGNEHFGLKIAMGFKFNATIGLPSTVLFNYDNKVDSMSSFFADGEFVANKKTK